MAKKIEVLFGGVTRGGAGGELGVDEDNKLYWNGKLLVTKQKITLQWWVNISIFAGAVATLALAVIGWLKFFGYGSP